MLAEVLVGDCDSARVTFGGGELGSEMSTFEVDDVSDDIRSSVSNGFSSSKASMVVPDGDYIAQDAENDVCLLRRHNLAVREFNREIQEKLHHKYTH